MSSKDILSEEEREALLSGVESGAVETEGNGRPAMAGVRDYSFTSQEHILRGPMPTLDMIHDRFARHFRSGLYNLLQRGAEIEAGQVEPMRFTDYTNQLQHPAVLHLVQMHPLQGMALFLMDAPLVHELVDGFFGGSGRPSGRSDERDLTPSELRVATLVLQQSFKDLATAWAPVMEVTFEHRKSETNPRFVNVVSPGETVLVARFAVRFGKNGGELHVVLPQALIEPVRESLDGGIQSDRAANDQHWADALGRGLRDAKVELRAVLVETELKLRDVHRLKPGDVIAVDLPEEVPVYAEGLPMFVGAYGVYKGSNSVKLVRRNAVQSGVGSEPRN